MAGKTNIEWTEQSWNPIVGCSIVSPGCTNCYAMKMAHRLQAMADKPRWTKKGVGTGHYAGTTKVVNGNAVWTGKLALAPSHVLTAPLRRKKPTTYFVNSMGDLFHEDCPDEWILDALTIMAIARQHTFQVLTKRAERMRDFMSNPDLLQEIMVNWWSFDDGMRGVESWPLPNVWLGVSTEDQRRADDRIPHLLATPTAVRFVSAEPLLGPINLTHIDLPGGDEEIFPLGWPEGRDDEPCHPHLDWVIAGGESGPNARPMHPDWARSLRDQCEAARVPFFFKQWGEWGPYDRSRHDGATLATPFSTDMPLQRFGKKLAGRLLDGTEHNGVPA